MYKTEHLFEGESATNEVEIQAAEPVDTGQATERVDTGKAAERVDTRQTAVSISIRYGAVLLVQL